MNENKYQLAKFSTRFLAFFIDRIIIMIVLSPFITMIFGVKEKITIKQFIKMLEQGELPFTVSEILFNLFIVAAFVIGFWIYRGATPAKIFFKIKIVDMKTGKHPTNMQFLIRYLGYFLSVFSLGFGFLLALTDQKGQALHDKISGTMVISQQNFIDKDEGKAEQSKESLEKNDSFEA